MANIVIVTNRCYLLAEAINHISVNEKDPDARKEEDWNPSRKRKKKRKPTKAERAKAIQNAPYQVIIDFIPVSKGNHQGQSLNKHGSNDESCTVAITVYGRDRCLDLFADMVAQIREQLPDQMFLDKLVEKFLSDNNLEKL